MEPASWFNVERGRHNQAEFLKIISAGKGIDSPTEVGIIHRLRKENPRKEFIPAYNGAICTNMRLNTLERVYLSLKEEKHLITVPDAVARKARRTLEKMFSILGA